MKKLIIWQTVMTAIILTVFIILGNNYAIAYLVNIVFISFFAVAAKSDQAALIAVAVAFFGNSAVAFSTPVVDGMNVIVAFMTFVFIYSAVTNFDLGLNKKTAMLTYIWQFLLTFVPLLYVIRSR